MFPFPSPMMMTGQSASLSPVQTSFGTVVWTGDGTNGRSLFSHVSPNLVLVKKRDFASAISMFDTVRGPSKVIVIGSAAPTTDTTTLSAFNEKGFTVNSSLNSLGDGFVAWVLAASSRVLAIKQYTGNGTSQTINPGLDAGVSILKVVVKNNSSGGNLATWHKGLTAGRFIYQNVTTAEQTNNLANAYGNNTTTVTPTASGVTIGNLPVINTSGSSYMMYIYAEDPATSGFMKGGSFTTDASGNGSFSTGWTEGAQWIELKCASAAGDWEIFDTVRTPGFAGDDARTRFAVTNYAEDLVARVSQSGGVLSFTGLTASAKYIITAVRAP